MRRSDWDHGETGTEAADDIAPARLTERTGALGQGLAAYAAATGSEPHERRHEPAAWAGLTRRLGAPPRARLGQDVLVAFAAATVAFALVTLLARPRHDGGELRARAPAAANARVVERPAAAAVAAAPRREVAATAVAPRAPLGDATSAVAPRAPLGDATSAVAPRAPLGDATSAVAPRAPLGDATSAVAPHALILGAVAVTIPPGESAIAGRGHLRLDAAGRASARLIGDAAEVALADGALALAVPRDRQGPWRVLAGPFTFIDAGTVFTVGWHGGIAELEVSEGTVEVWRAGGRLAVVHDGRWSSAELATAERAGPSPLAPPAVSQRRTARAAPASPTATSEASATPLPRPAPRGPLATAAPPAPDRGCVEHVAADDIGRALACYDAQAAGTDLAAETALYELGRLRRDRRGDLAGALAAFEQYRRRFPGGVLAVEATLSIIDLLPRLGRPRDALGESARLLAGGAARERADELHLLRGNLLRQSLHDCAGALAEYAAVHAPEGHTSDDAAFLRASCLVELGRRPEAAAGLRAYLDRPDAARRPEAERLRAAITP